MAANWMHRHPTLVTPTKHGGCRQFPTNRCIQSGCVASAILGRAASCGVSVEVQFFLAGISSEKIKFCHVILQLDYQYTTEVEDMITSLPDQYPYTMLKTEFMRWLSSSREQRIHQLLTLEMGDHMLSQFLRHLRSLAPDMPDDFLLGIWSSWQPPNVQTILTGQHKGSLNAAARCADCISEVASQPALTSTGPPPDNTALLQVIESPPPTR
ncbi:uncharacterized protein LOC117282751 isoform X2 [Cryptotermes secundus]|uniref:uncharacterized protein LOC117282751 isoform X2 n=1 Tax=Cryptotermes secundus TaxID=105785 RepID=UPI001454C0B5|nr:uncharacterized protein LOC117282751 isoform X2 [Cryptotermes secundus]